MGLQMKTLQPVQEQRPDPLDEADPPADVRSSRIYLFSRGPLTTLVRRLLSVAALVVLDIAGLALGIYIALVLRSVLFGKPVFWSLLWRDGPAEWLKFLAPVCVLVFWRAGLYAERERRSGSGTVVSSLVLVALIVLAFGFGTGYDFTTTGLIPTAIVTSALTIGLLRAAYASFALEVMKVAGIRRRVVLAGKGDSLLRLRRELGAARGTIGYDLVGSISPTAEPGLRLLGTSVDDIPGILAREHPDELILAEADFDERTVLEIVERAHRMGVKVRLAPNTTELLVQKGGVCARHRAAALRAASADSDWHRLGVEAHVRRARQRLPRRPGIASVAPCRRSDQARIPRSGLLRRPQNWRRRARVRDAQVSHDGRRCRGPAGSARAVERGIGCTIQDPRRSTRHRRRPATAAPLD